MSSRDERIEEFERVSERPTFRRSVQTPLRIVVISDTHNMHERVVVPDGDILVHCGDLSNNGKRKKVLEFNDWMKKMPHKHKLVVLGNHDVGVFSSITPTNHDLLFDGCTVLDNTSVNIHGLEFYGSGWNRKGRRDIPEGVDVLVTHAPPAGVLDGAGYGDDFLLKDIAKLAQKPSLHLFGHCHEGRGVTTYTFEEDNASTECDSSASDGAVCSDQESACHHKMLCINAAVANPGMMARRIVSGCYVIDL